MTGSHSLSASPETYTRGWPVNITPRYTLFYLPHGWWACLGQYRHPCPPVLSGTLGMSTALWFWLGWALPTCPSLLAVNPVQSVPHQFSFHWQCPTALCHQKSFMGKHLAGISKSCSFSFKVSFGPLSCRKQRSPRDSRQKGWAGGTQGMVPATSHSAGRPTWPSLTFCSNIVFYQGCTSKILHINTVEIVYSDDCYYTVIVKFKCLSLMTLGTNFCFLKSCKASIQFPTIKCNIIQCILKQLVSRHYFLLIT